MGWYQLGILVQTVSFLPSLNQVLVLLYKGWKKYFCKIYLTVFFNNGGGLKHAIQFSISQLTFDSQVLCWSFLHTG